YSPDGKHIVSGSDDTTVCIWDAETGRAVGDPLKGHAAGIYSIAYSPSGEYIVSASSDSTICIWDARTGKAVCNSLQGHASMITSVAYSPDGTHIVSSSLDTTIRVWNVKMKAADLHVLQYSNGWITDSESHLLIWVPDEYRNALWWPGTEKIIGRTPIEIDFKHAKHGVEWTKCMDSVESESDLYAPA
ncbi:WD40-repeat-containing domain protein, partial [Amylostereum chailletii]